MTLKKQLGVLPTNTGIQIVENGNTVFDGVVYDARRFVRESVLNPSAYVSRVIPLGDGKARILIKSKERNSNNIIKEED